MRVGAKDFSDMDVQIVEFPETRVACVEHRGPPELEHATASKLLQWKRENRLMDPLKHKNFGVHYTNPRTTPQSEHRVDFCISIEDEILPNSLGIVSKVIPRSRCARARDVGSRFDNKAALYLMERWLPQSGESMGDFPMFFHYVNVGPNVREAEMITDVYLPLK